MLEEWIAGHDALTAGSSSPAGRRCRARADHALALASAAIPKGPIAPAGRGAPAPTRPSRRRWSARGRAIARACSRCSIRWLPASRQGQRRRASPPRCCACPASPASGAAGAPARARRAEGAGADPSAGAGLPGVPRYRLRAVSPRRPTGWRSIADARSSALDLMPGRPVARDRAAADRGARFRAPRSHRAGAGAGRLAAGRPARSLRIARRRWRRRAARQAGCRRCAPAARPRRGGPGCCGRWRSSAAMPRCGPRSRRGWGRRAGRRRSLRAPLARRLCDAPGDPQTTLDAVRAFLFLGRFDDVDRPPPRRSRSPPG